MGSISSLFRIEIQCPVPLLLKITFLKILLHSCTGWEEAFWTHGELLKCLPLESHRNGCQRRDLSLAALSDSPCSVAPPQFLSPPRSGSRQNVPSESKLSKNFFNLPLEKCIKPITDNFIKSEILEVQKVSVEKWRQPCCIYHQLGKITSQNIRAITTQYKSGYSDLAAGLWANWDH